MELHDEQKSGRQDQMEDLSQLLYVLRYTRPLSIRGAARQLGFSAPAMRLGLRRLRLNIHRQLGRMARSK